MVPCVKVKVVQACKAAIARKPAWRTRAVNVVQHNVKVDIGAEGLQLLHDGRWICAPDHSSSEITV